MPTGAIIGGAAALGGSLISADAAGDAADAQKDAAKDSNALQRYIYEQNRDDLSPYRLTGTAALNQLARIYGLPVYDQEGIQNTQRLDDLTGQRNALLDRLWGSDPNRGRWGAMGISSREGNDWSELTDEQLARIAGGGSGRQAFRSGVMQLRDVDSQIDNLEQVAPQAGQPGGEGGQFDSFFESPDYQVAVREGNQALDRSAAARGRLFSGGQLKATTRYNQDMGTQQFQNYANRLASIAGIGQTATNTTVNAGQGYAANAGNALMNAGAARASGYAGQANAINSGINNALQLYGMYQGGYFGGGNTGGGFNNYGSINGFNSGMAYP